MTKNSKTHKPASRRSVDDLEHPAGPTKDAYEEELAELQLQMLRIQCAYRAQGRRAILAFEGTDAAGKGGAIRRMTARLDPRGVKVHAIGAPTKEEQGRHYLYRFWRELPVPGQLAVFDRSWYGRVLVERVEGFCKEEAWSRAYDEINAFEKMLVDDGAVLIKVLLCIDRGEQHERFADRLHDPVKRWKFTRDDLRNRNRWDDYVSAFDEMLVRTDTTDAPWVVIGANTKRHARLATLRAVTQRLSADVDLTAPLAPHALIREATASLGLPLPPDVAPADPSKDVRGEDAEGPKKKARKKDKKKRKNAGKPGKEKKKK
ncbi:MAG: polyphosphate kinase 2 family protein [Nannocystales bacterium]